MDYRFKKSNAEIRPIKGIQFSVISSDFIKNVSVTQQMEYAGQTVEKGVHNDTCYDPKTGQPNFGAINDPRMGNMYDVEHPGYFGHIELVSPVYHIGFLKTVVDILRCVSYYSSTLLIDRESYVSRRSKKKNLKEITKLSKSVKICPVTQQRLPTYSKEGTKIAIDFGQGKEIISPSDVYKILEKISDEDAKVLGFNPNFSRPECLLLSTVPVPPPHVRPSVFMSSSQKCDDDLTTKLNEIVKTNISLGIAIEKANASNDATTTEHYVSQLESLLQYNINTFIDNQHPGQPPSLQRSGKPLKTLRERLAGKDGRVRGNLMGKRVDFSARTVITADPNLSIDQVGVPKNIAMNLTIPEIVTDYNKEYLLALVKAGPHQHPGAKFLIRNGSKIDLNYAKNITELKNGWVVERHLIDDDAVLFNRQPSLHKMSIMAHRVKVLQGSTFRLNLAVTSPYNADFDGDEMNLHVPQSLNARAEAEQLMKVDKLIVSPQANKPVMGIIQDSLLSSAKMTRRNVLINKAQLMNMIMIVDNWDGNIPFPAIVKNGPNGPIEYWTGKQIFSLIIPKTLTIERMKSRNQHNPEDRGIFIQRGQVLSGCVDKAVIGKSQGGLIHILFNDFGPDTTKVFLNQVQKISNYWIKHHGFTIGVGDAIAGPKAMKHVENILKTTRERIQNAISSGTKDPRQLEEYINTELNAATSEAGKKAEESLTFHNNFKAAVSSGSKGSSINISQIMAAVGQQNVEGRRIGYQFKGRTLPHFPRNDVGQHSRGFVENSYLKGLTPQEFFFHAMAGREGLIDTACKSVTGDTPVVIIEDGKSKCVEIGSWIDQKLSGANVNDIHTYEEQLDTELLNLKQEVWVPTCDNKGKSSWGKVTAVTRHDPTEDMYEVTTYSGRKVKVTESTSLIVWNGEEFQRKLTSEIKEGECVPVLAELPEPPVIVDKVQLSEYFPKTEYIYGTEFHTAKTMMKEVMSSGLIGDRASKKAKEEFNRTRIPRGWWQKHNGKSFTTPYTKKASLQRAIVRSLDVEKGYIYPYSANRKVKLPDTFELNEEFGIFTGLYLAEGCVDVKTGKVSIANNDQKVRTFVSSWFEKYGFKYKEYSKDYSIQEGKEHYTSISIQGYSTLLAKFFKMWCGNGSANKYVPNEAYTAPKEFVKGLLNGYFSGDGTVNKSGRTISANSVSKNLIDGIAILSSRFGIFGRITSYQAKKNNVGSKNILLSHIITINGQWSEQFAITIPLIIDYKQERLNNLLTKDPIIHCNFPVTNDTVLDQITKIEKIEHLNKVYDFSVPSTGNFGNAVNLITKNTSETGYIQRRLVKALEDVSVRYDNTVRNSRGMIIQFLYGEDGLDATHLENVNIDILKLTEKQLKERYYNSEIPKEYSIIQECQTELLKIAKNRELNNAKYSDDYFPMPANLSRILKYARNLKYQNSTPIDPEWCYSEVLYLTNRIAELFNDASTVVEEKRSYNASRIFCIYIHSMLAYNLIKDLNRSQLLYVIEETELKFRKAIANPGEMCGILAAQSIGEPATQMSQIASSGCFLSRPDGTMYRGTLGKFMDPFFKGSDGSLVSEVVDLQGYKILSVDPHNEKVSWQEISQLSRHPANGELVKVTTKSGKTTTATLSHSFLKRTEAGIVPVLGKDLKVGHRIPVAKQVPTVENPLNEYKGYKLTKDFGWFVGVYLADGSINYHQISICKIIPEFYNNVIRIVKDLGLNPIYKRREKGKKTFGPQGNTKFTSKELSEFLIENFNKGSENKRIGAFVFQSNLEFIAGIISGYFDGDGNVNSQERKQMIRSSSISEQLTIDMIQLLSYFGIFASKCVEKTKNHTIQISRKYARTFKERIGLIVKKKANALDEIIKYVERPDAHSQCEFIDKIPELGETLASAGKKLGLPSRTYGRYKKKESIGRETLIKYIKQLEELDVDKQIASELIKLRQAAFSDVVWDSIIKIEILKDPKEYVYDFTVPSTESFLIDCNILVHNTLNTFHYAGVSAKNVTLGVPRLKELINVTKKLKTPSLTLYEDGQISKYSEIGQKRMIEMIRSQLEYKTLQDIIESSDIIDSQDPEYENDDPVIEIYREITGSVNQLPQKFWSLRLSFQAKDLEYVDITMSEIAELLRTHINGDPMIIFSDDNDSNLFIRIIVGEANNDEELTLFDLRKIEILCMGIKLKGHEGIDRVYTRKIKINDYDTEKGHFKREEWLLETEGSNLVGSMRIKGIDHTRTVSNNVLEIYEVFGIEAARQALLNELRTVLSFDGSYVNYRHLAILVDTMTCRGSLTAMTRHGINRVADVGTLTKCSFEETVEILTDAAAFGEYDNLKGISDNIMLGQMVPAGTGSFDVLYDPDMEPDIREAAPSREPTPGLPRMVLYVPSIPDYDPMEPWEQAT